MQASLESKQPKPAVNQVAKVPPESAPPPKITTPSKAKPEKDAPSLHRPGAFFIKREITIYAPSNHIISRVYSKDAEKSKDSYGQFSGTLLDASFDEYGRIIAGIVRYREAGSRKLEETDLMDLQGCFISASLVRDDFLEEAESIKN